MPRALVIILKIIWHLTIIALAFAWDAVRWFYFFVVLVPLTLVEGYEETRHHYGLK